MDKSPRYIWNEALSERAAASKIGRVDRERIDLSKGGVAARLTTVRIETASAVGAGAVHNPGLARDSLDNGTGGFNGSVFTTHGRTRRLLASFLAQAIALALAPAVSAQVVIPAGTDIGTYLNTGTNWSATNNQFAINANATWNNVINPSTAAHSVLTINGNGNRITRAGNYVVHYDNTSVNGNSITFSNLTFGQTASSSLAIFDNDATTARTLNIHLNNVTFNGLTGAGYGGSVFLMYPNTAPNNNVVMNVTAGTGANGVVMSNNSRTGDSGGVVGMYSGLLNFYGDYTFNSNSTGNYGGAIAMYQTNGVMTFNGAAAFNNNFATNYFGGAVDIWGGSSTLTFNGPTTFTGNRVVSPQTEDGNPRGGAINIGYTAPTIAGQPALVQFNNNVTFDGNYVVSTGAGGYAYGGAISAYGNGASYNYQYIFNNAAIFQNNYVVKAGTGVGTGNGGAIYYDASGALVSLTSGTQFLDNYASTNGGAIYLQSGTISLNALTNNILFEGNRRGISFGASGTYAPIPGTGTPNAIFLGSSGNLNLNANAGYQIQFYDPISSTAGSTVTVTKSGNGEAIFYGDNGASTTYDSTIQANTTVNGGYFTLADGVNYGIATSGAFIVTTGTGTQGTVQGGNNSSLRALTLTVQNGGTVGVTGGIFSLNVPTINVQSGGRFGGNGTLAATSNINIAGTTIANINAGNTLNIAGHLAGSGGITAQGGGVLDLSNPSNSYTGATTVAAGSTLMGGVANAFATSGSVAVNGTLDLSRNSLNQTANSLSGTGSVLLGSATLTASNGATNTTFSGGISGPGSLTKTGTGTLTLSGTSSTYGGGTTISAGTLVATHGGALGTGLVTDSATLQLDFAANSTLANQLAGSGLLSKTSAGVATLTGINSSVGTVNVSAGTLDFEQSGGFAVTNNLTTGSGATTTLGANAHLTVTNAFTEVAGSTLNVNIGTSNAPLISSASASLNGTLNVASFAGTPPASASALPGTQYTIIRTTGGITGDFSSVHLGSATSPVDYLTLAGGKTANNLDYNVGFGLTWLAGPNLGNGVFTLTSPTDAFNVDVVLANQSAAATGWDGTTLTKNGAGTLTLSALNTYTGATIINGGTLATGIANAFASSNAVTVNTGSTLALNDHNQSVHLLSGAGTVNLGTVGTTVLTVNGTNSPGFSGVIQGAGSLHTSNGVLLTGANTYTGGTTITANQLQLGNGGTTGSIVGNVIDNGTLAFDRSDIMTFAGVISGSGAVTQNGSGTVILTAANSYAGGTTIANTSTLQLGSGGTTGSIVGNVADFHTLAFDRSDVVTFDGVISGSGGVQQLGSGSTILTAANTYTGSTTITAGTLQLGNGGTMGSIASTGSVADNGILAFDRSDAVTFANPISGSGGVHQLGSGTTTLTGINTYAGGTTISAGTLTGSATSFGSGPVRDNAALIIDQPSNASFANLISGTGSFTKSGAGTLSLTGTNSSVGITTAAAGTLAFAQPGVFNAASYITLSGATTSMGGTSQLAVTGAFTQAGGAALDVTIGSNNPIITAATGALNGTLNLTGFSASAPTSASALTSTQFTVLHTTGGITGDFTSVNLGSATSPVDYLTVAAGKTANNLDYNVGFGLTWLAGPTLGNGVFTLANAPDTFNVDVPLSNQVASATGWDGTTLTKNGAGTLTLSALNTYAGATIINGGTLATGIANTFATSSAVTVSGGATLALNGFSQIANDLSGAGSITLGSATLTANNSTTSTSFAGGISGTGALDKTGAASLTLSGANTYSGGTALSAGTLMMGSASALGTGTLAMAAGTTLDFLGSYTVNNAVTLSGDPTFNVNTGLTTTWTGNISDGSAAGVLDKTGAGTLVLTATNTYSGGSALSAGTLMLGNASALGSGTLAMAAGTTLDFLGSYTVNNAVTLSGDPTFNVSTGLTTTWTGSISDGTVAGVLNKTGPGTLVLTAANTYSGGTALSAGTVVATNGSALGTGAISNSAALQLDFASNSTLANSLSGTGSLTNTGTGITTLSASGSSAGAVAVNAGTLQFGQSGAFTAASYITQSGATTAIGGAAQLAVTGAFTQAASSALDVTLGSNNPVITAGTAALNGTLDVAGFSAGAPTSASALTSTQFTVLQTTGGITGDFTSVNLGSATSPVDYLTLAGAKTANNLDYNVGFGLTWLAGPSLGNGVFTLANAPDTFNVDVVLVNQTGPFTSGWDGATLTKNGAGTLTLSALNTYTGATIINGGTLATGIANTFATSSAVTVNSGATLALNGFSQIANNLSGAGNVVLDPATLTVNSTTDTTFAGTLSGPGSLVKSGAAALTLSGVNSYSGGSTLSAGTVVATNGSALGTGAISNSAALQLDFASNGTLANSLSGTGSLTNTGTGITTLSASGSSADAVAVNAGTLQFGQSGAFTAASYITQSGATTAIGGAAQLAVTGAFTQAASSALDVTLGSNNPVITAGTAALNGTLDVAGFSAGAPTSASALTSTQFTVLQTTGGITGDFTSVNLGSATSPVDYLTLAGAKTANNLDYNVGFGLTWLAGPSLGNGVFTLANAPDTFNVDVVLVNQTGPFTSGWDGATLTKNGAGTLTLSALNTYTGATIINGGTLATGIANTFATSSAVTVNGGATLALNGFSQIANDLSGAGSITLGSATLTANNSATSTSFAGTISGTGALDKTGAASLTLSGVGSSVGAVDVQAGAMALTQSGAFTATGYSTETGATTSIGGASQLTMTGAFTQAAGAVLDVTLGSNNPIITAGTGALNGSLSVTGFSASAPTSASALTSTQFTVLQTTGGITGDFTSVNLGGATSPVDYLTVAAGKTANNLDYNVGFGLTWLAGPTVGNGVFTLANAPDTFNVDVPLSNQAASATGWDGATLTKNGAGTLTLSALNTYTGATIINGGTLATDIANTFATSSAVTVNSGATLALNGFSQIANNLSGAGNVVLDPATLTVNSTTDTTFAGTLSGPGSLVKSGAAALTLSGVNSYSGGSTLSAGTVVATNGSALGTGAISNSAALQLDFASNGTLANSLSGTGSLTNTGTGITTLSASGSSAGAVAVNAGTLQFGQSGAFTAASYITQSGATTAIGGAAQLAVTGAFTQAAGAALDVTLGSNNPVITAGTAALNGTLDVAGFSAGAPTSASALTSTQFTVLQTTGGITGDFTSVNLGNATSPVDYLTLAGAKTANNLDYNVGFGLTWLAGPTLGNGVFTLANAPDTFNVDVPLSNQAASTTGWDGTTLTKNGAGTLTLSALNTYTGATIINGGTLATGIANTFATSSAVTVNSGATLALNGFSQIANNLSGAGSITLGSATLTANNSATSTSFAGTISGTGALDKTGAAILTLSGANTYSGGTTLSAGTLVATNGSALGTGAVSNSAALQLDFAGNGTLANSLSGTGSLTNTGTGITTLSASGSSEGAVAVNAGALQFGQSGAFTAASYITQSGATTAIGAAAQLAVTGAFTQAAGAALDVAIGSNQPIITASMATLNGALDVASFSAGAPTSASALASTQFTLLHTTGGITGDFSSVTLGSASSPVDYLTLAGGKTANNLDYNVGFGLTWLAGPTSGNGVFTLANATDVFNVDVPLSNQAASTTGWDGTTLTKNGAGTLTLSALNTYTGPTLINGGTLTTGIANTIADSSAVTVASGATLALNGFNQIINELSGAGTVDLGSAVMTVQNTGSTVFAGLVSGSGSVTKTGIGSLTLSGANTYRGGTMIAAGTLTATNGAALGTGVVTNDATLDLGFSANGSLANTLTGTGLLQKTGASTVTLTGTGSNVGSVAVQQGTLQFAQTGVFITTGNYTTQSGATTYIGQPGAALGVGGVFTQTAGATLDVTVGSAPDITAQSAVLNGALVINGFNEGSIPVKASDITNGQRYTLLHTTNGITGNFANNPLQPSGLDYLLHESSISPNGQDYQLGFQLAWTQGGVTNGTGAFTLGANTAFNVDIPLANQTVPSGGFASGWDGQSLTKNGAGLLVLSDTNSYTGATIVNGGTLQTAVANAFASSANVAVNGGTLDLDGHSQLANRLAGSGGAILLNGATLTANNAASTDSTAFAGAIGDGTNAGGNLVKTGTGTLTLAGPLSYTGATTLFEGTLALSGGADLSASAATSLPHSGTTLSIAGVNGAGAGVQNLSGVSGSQLVLAGKTLTVTNSTDTIFAGAIDASSGSLIKNGSGSLNLSGPTGYTGTTELHGGQLILDGSVGGAQLSSDVVGQAGTALSLLNGAALTGWIDPTDVTISPTSTWHITANSTVGTLTLAGLAGFVAPPSPMTAGRTLTVTNLVGQGGTLGLYTVLGNSASISDQLIINGGSVSGLTHLAIQNAGGLGDRTTGNGIPVVSVVNGGSTATGTFDLASQVLAGPYEYTLQRGSSGASNDWFLANNAPGILPDYRAETSLYSDLSGEALRYGEAVLGTLRERMGALGELGASNDRYVWGRVIGQSDRNDGAAEGIYAHDVRSDVGLAALQVGGDLYVTSHGADRISAGVYGAIGESRGTVDHIDTFGVPAQAGNNTLKAYSLGVYTTWLDGRGGYLDAVLQGTHYDVSSESVNRMRLTTSSNGVAASLEAGKRFELQPGLGLEPQAQVVYQSVGTSNAHDQAGDVSFDRANSALLRIGARLSKALDTDGATPSSAWLTLNILHNTGGSATTRFATPTQGDVLFYNNYPGTRLGLQAGIDAQVAKNILFNVRFGAERSIDSRHLTSYAGQFGVKVAF